MIISYIMLISYIADSRSSPKELRQFNFKATRRLGVVRAIFREGPSPALIASCVSSTTTKRQFGATSPHSSCT